MGAAEVIAFEEVRARKQWDTLRHQLHERFDQWLDTLETQWHEPPSTLPEVTATVWALRQQLTGGITETIVAHGHRGEHDRHQATCPRCHGMVRARDLVCRTIETMVGAIQLDRSGALPHHASDDATQGKTPAKGIPLIDNATILTPTSGFLTPHKNHTKIDSTRVPTCRRRNAAPQSARRSDIQGTFSLWGREELRRVSNVP